MCKFLNIIIYDNHFNQSLSCVNIATPLSTQWSEFVDFSIGKSILNT